MDLENINNQKSESTYFPGLWGSMRFSFNVIGKTLIHKCIKVFPMTLKALYANEIRKREEEKWEK